MGLGRQAGIGLQRDDALRPVAEQRGEMAGGGADLEHLLVALHLQLLQQTRFDLGREHAPRGGQRQFDVDEGLRPVSLGHKVLAVNDLQQLQHAGIEHVPGADLLLDHVEAGLFEVHLILRGSVGQTEKQNSRGEAPQPGAASRPCSSSDICACSISAAPMEGPHTS